MKKLLIVTVFALSYVSNVHAEQFKCKVEMESASTSKFGSRTYEHSEFIRVEAPHPMTAEDEILNSVVSFEGMTYSQGKRIFKACVSGCEYTITDVTCHTPGASTMPFMRSR